MRQSSSVPNMTRKDSKMKTGKAVMAEKAKLSRATAPLGQKSVATTAVTKRKDNTGRQTPSADVGADGKVRSKEAAPKKHPKFGRQSGPEAKAMYALRTELLTFSDSLATVKCNVLEAITQSQGPLENDIATAGSRPSSSRRADKSRLRKLQLILVKMSNDLDDIALRDAQSRGKSLARSSITDWPTKQANETRRIRKKCAGTIETLLDSIETAFSKMQEAKSTDVSSEVSNLDPRESEGAKGQNDGGDPCLESARRSPAGS